MLDRPSDAVYRPMPFWSWNDRLDPAVCVRQIGYMADAGMGGFVMYARGGLQTPYLGEDWFAAVSASLAEGQRRGLRVWAYDENGWPSGFGDGRVNGRGEPFWQKYLRLGGPDTPVEPHRVIARDGERVLYYDVNPYYVDTLDPAVTAAFLQEVYEPYAARYGSALAGFFTDEPQISRAGIPWSLTLPDAYRDAYGDDLLPHLCELFEETGDYVTTRLRFWRLVTVLFSQNYMKQIHDWCAAHGVALTGHLVLEETLESQLTANGACMPHYEYFDIPGMDWLCRPVFDCLTVHQLASAAAQTGKRQILTETYALCGQDLSLEMMRRNYEWMAVRGVNVMCQHLLPYSLRGLRKRDCPPALFYQQPWWPSYRDFNLAAGRLGRLLAEGEPLADTLVIHNQSSAWACYNSRDNGEIKRYEQGLLSVIRTLEKKHVAFHLGDEILMERHARVEGTALVVGAMRYTRVILPDHRVLLPHTERLLAEYRRAGGVFVTAEELPPEGPVDDPAITYTCRRYPDHVLRYFVNSTAEEHTVSIRCGGRAVDLVTGEETPFTGRHTFAPGTGLVIRDDGAPPAPAAPARRLAALDTAGEWEAVAATPNALTLDTCTYWFDGELQQTQAPVLRVTQQALALGRPVAVVCEFTVEADCLPDDLFLACEDPERCILTVNGAPVDPTDCGYFVDESFRLRRIGGLMRPGVNVIRLQTTLIQSPEVYAHLERARHFESEKNNLNFDQEIEALYLVGDFGVRSASAFTPAAGGTVRTAGPFVLTAPPRRLALSHLEQQGLPFFAGQITLRRTFTLMDTDRCLRLCRQGGGVITATVNGTPVRLPLQNPCTADLSDLLRPGENTVELTLQTTLRNLLGPHHHPEGEPAAVWPGAFFDQPCIWNDYRAMPYEAGVRLVPVSLA